MKKATFALCALLMTTSFAEAKKYAQNQMPAQQQTMTYQQATPERSMLTMIPFVGIGSSTFSGMEGRNGFEIKPQTSFQGGGTLLIGRSDLQAETGIFYSKKGMVVEHTLFAGKLEYDLRYLEIPLIARYTFPSQGTSFYMKGGAVIGLLQTANGKDSFNNVPDKDIKNLFNGVDTQAQIGGGMNIPLNSKLKLQLEANYQLSVTRMSDSAFSDGIDARNSNLSLTSGLAFDL